MPDAEKPFAPVPESKVVAGKRRRFSAIWLIPAVAAAAAIWIGITTIRSQGPKLTIVFRSAEGLEAGKTKVRYQGIDVGEISDLRISDDHLKVIATAKMSPKTESFLVKDTKFWVVRPQISGATITGLGTLISGAYVGVEIGQSKQREHTFVALDDAPLEIGGIHGRYFSLKSSQLGSLTKGTPVYFRRLQAGQVASYELDKDGKAVSVKIFVQSPYDEYVTADTRFWQASGLSVSLSASGMQIQTESLLSLLIGGVVFETPETDDPAPPARSDSVFALFKSREEAFRPAAINPQTYQLVFKESVRGLTVGAPVEFEGIPIGEVKDVQAQFDPKSLEFSVPVTIEVDPGRFGVRTLGLSASEAALLDHKKVMDSMIARGARARLQTGSLVTGSKFIAFDFVPNAAPAILDWSQTPVRLPTVPGEVQSIEEKLASILNKLDQMQFKEISDDLRKTISNLDKVLVDVRGTLTNTDQLLGSADKLVNQAGQLIEPNSVLVQGLDGTIQEMGGAAKALRILADYLERHPEALIRGKPGEAK